MKNDKWSMFKNYMHNELGITKEDIEKWVRDAVKSEARKLVDNEYGKFDMREEIEKIFKEKFFFGSDTFNRATMSTFRDVLMERLEIKIKE